MNLETLKWDDSLLKFFELKPSVLPKIVSSSELYGELAGGALKGVKITGIAGDQQAALIGNKCLKQGEAKCTYGTGAFLLFCTGDEIVLSNHGLLSTVRMTDFISNLSTEQVWSVRLHTRTVRMASLCTPLRVRLLWLVARSSGCATLCPLSPPRKKSTRWPDPFPIAGASTS